MQKECQNETFFSSTGPPELNGEGHEIIEVLESQTANLLCNMTAGGGGTVSITWQKDGRALDETMRHKETTYMQIASSVSSFFLMTMLIFIFIGPPCAHSLCPFGRLRRLHVRG